MIISASGMATGGRVLGHLAAMAPGPRHPVVFPCFQVGGTRGAKMIAGATELKVFGACVPARALRARIADDLRWPSVRVPARGEAVET